MKYDLLNEDYKEHLETLCLANLPIEFYGQTLRHLTVREIMLMGERYNKLILPFTLSKDMLPMDYNGEFYVLEVLLCSDMNEYLIDAIEILKLLFDTDKINVFKEEIVVNEKLFIDKYRFEELVNIILKMLNLTKYKKPKNNGEKYLTLEQIKNIEDIREQKYQMSIYKKRQKEERKKYKFVSLSNVYNCVANLNGIDYEKPLNLNIYQLYNTFTVLNKKEQYSYVMKVATSGFCSDVKKLDLRSLPERVAFDYKIN